MRTRTPPRRPRRATAVVAATMLAGMLAAGPAPADHPPVFLPWPDLLPPASGAPAEPDGGECAELTPACVDAVLASMEAIWEPLDAACEPRAVFALTYLRTTEAFRETLGAGRFRDEPWIIRLDKVFADLYFDAVDAPAGEAPPVWEIAFAAADERRTNAGQDVLLGMNAHIQRDLPIALATVGLADPAGASHKPDHDEVNRILAAIVDEIQDELAARYDPVIAWSDASPSPADEIAIIEMIKGWREQAWRNAERLALAGSAEEQALVLAWIEAYAEAWAHLIAAPDFSSWAGSRLAHCEAFPRP